MEQIQSIMAAMYRGEITSEEAAAKLAKAMTVEQLAEAYIDAFNRGWISRFNLGIDEDGKVI